MMGRDYIGDLDINGRIILKQILKKHDVTAWNGFIWLRIGSLVGSCEHSNELLGFIKPRNFLTNRMTISFSKRILPLSKLVMEGNVCCLF
jgi:hypothetical protein